MGLCKEDWGCKQLLVSVFLELSPGAGRKMYESLRSEFDFHAAGGSSSRFKHDPPQKRPFLTKFDPPNIHYLHPPPHPLENRGNLF